MPDPIVARVRDADGRIHYGARQGSVIAGGLADGSLVDVDAEEENDAASLPEDGDDHDAGARVDGSGDGESAPGLVDDGDDEGVA